MYLKPSVTNKVKNSVLITGSARSGTTIMGKIVHSMKNVEYTFEPPTLFPLFAKINDLDSETWKLLFEVYLYEDFFSGAIAGRNLNFNRLDDSCIYNAKSEDEISRRMEASLRKQQLELSSDKGVIAFKMPDIVPFLRKFKEYYSQVKVIFMQRNPVDTLNSLVKKGWFSDDSLKKENRVWPLIKYENNLIPYWVSNTDYDLWVGMSEIDRYGYYFIKMNYLPSTVDALVINYDNLIQQPEKQATLVAKYIGAEFGQLTEKLVAQVEKTTIERDDNILNKLNSDIREKINSLMS